MVSWTQLKTKLFNMIKHLLLASSLLTSIGVSAQCSTSIGSSTTPITTNMTTLSTGDFWVCDGLLATDNNTASTIYLEDNASLNCYGCSATIYAKAGTTVNIYSNGTATVYHDAGASVFDVGGMANVNSCPSVTFDYTNAPGGGCVAGVGITEQSLGTFSVYPNPNKGQFTIDLSELTEQAAQINIYSIDGRAVYSANNLGNTLNLDLSELDAGYYSVIISSENGDKRSSSSLVIQ